MATSESSRQSSPKTPDTSSIVTTDHNGNVLTGAERRAVSAVVRAHQDTYDNNEGLTAADVSALKLTAGRLEIKFDSAVVVSSKTTEYNLPDGWVFDSMITHGTGRTGVRILHENR